MVYNVLRANQQKKGVRSVYCIGGREIDETEKNERSNMNLKMLLLHRG